MVSVYGERYYDNRHQNFFYALEEVKGTDILRGIKFKDRFCSDCRGDRKENKRNTYVVERKDLTRIHYSKTYRIKEKEDKILKGIRQCLAYAQNNNQKRLAKKCIKFLLDIAQRNQRGRIKIL